MSWLVLFLLSCPALADESDESADSGDSDVDGVFEVTVLSDDDDGDVAGVPGSSTVVDAEQLEAMGPLSTSEALQGVAGLTIQEEDPFGLRQNIGVRGLEPGRSRKVLVLEDGVPIALGPYGEPGLYYTPPVEKLDGIEVVKGSGSILFGPRTIGGVINYRTAPSPRELSWRVSGEAGTWGHAAGAGEVGGTVGRVGMKLGLIHQRFDGPRSTNLQRSDVSARSDLRLGPGHTLVLKGGWYQAEDGLSYLGLTSPQFVADPNANPAQHDRFALRRWAAAATHGLALGPRVTLRTRLYWHDVDRDWRRQDFDRTDADGDYERIVGGDLQDLLGQAELPDDGSALFFRQTASTRRRAFDVWGVEPRLDAAWGEEAVQGELVVGGRFHWERVDEQRLDHSSPTADFDDGTVRDHALRRIDALAAYALHELTLWERLSLSPGARLEAISARTTTLVTQVTDPDTGERLSRSLQPAPVAESEQLVVLPGLGLGLVVNEQLSLFAGSHRGFAPPRTKDTVDDDGNTVVLDAEHSWNQELGLRWDAGAWSSGEVAGFWMDFSNQVVAPSEANATVSQGMVNGGRTSHLGAELSGRSDPARALGYGLQTPVHASLTLLRATYGEGWEPGEDGASSEGLSLPYAPAVQLMVSAGAVHPSGLSGQIRLNHVGPQFADAFETRTASVDGTVGQIPARSILDARLGYRHAPSGLDLQLAAKNLTDQVAIGSRAPSGIQPVLRRHLFAELSWSG